MDLAWKKSSDHADGTPGETRLKFESTVLSINWSPHETLLVGLNNGFVHEYNSLQNYDLIREKECHSKGKVLCNKLLHSVLFPKEK